jgi:hypothetical protein
MVMQNLEFGICNLESESQSENGSENDKENEQRSRDAILSRNIKMKHFHET